MSCRAKSHECIGVRYWLVNRASASDRLAELHCVAAITKQMQALDDPRTRGWQNDTHSCNVQCQSCMQGSRSGRQCLACSRHPWLACCSSTWSGASTGAQFISARVSKCTWPVGTLESCDWRIRWRILAARASHCTRHWPPHRFNCWQTASATATVSHERRGVGCCEINHHRVPSQRMDSPKCKPVWCPCYSNPKKRMGL